MESQLPQKRKEKKKNGKSPNNRMFNYISKKFLI